MLGNSLTWGPSAYFMQNGEKLASEWKTKGNEGVSHVWISMESVQCRRNGKCKGPKAESVWHTQEQEAGQCDWKRMTDVGEMLWEVRSESRAESNLP